MRFFRREVWGYATLLIVLFSIAALAVSETIQFLGERLSSDDFRVIAVLIWIITLGFMMIAGAFGLWAIQFAGESESRRRIGLLVDAMDYLRDGLISVGKSGRVVGSNPAARMMARQPLDTIESSLSEAFPCLIASDLSLLLHSDEPVEVERECTMAAGTLRILRFRSQPSDGVTLILVSDVTAMDSQRARLRQAASLQLIGEIAKGVAHDFNNLLWAISGNASILLRSKAIPPDASKSAEAIVKSAERGMAMAGRLIGLAQPALTGPGTHMPGDHMRNAAQSLRDALEVGWKVECSIAKNLPPVVLTGPQIEQVILNVGLLAADLKQQPGILRVEAASPDKNGLFNVGSRYACAVVITAADRDSKAIPVSAAAKDVPTESGVILSVVRSLLDDTGGQFGELVAPDGTPIYRLAFAPGIMPQMSPFKATPQLTEELKAYVAQWTVLLAFSPDFRDGIGTTLDKMGLRIERTDNVVGTLARIDDEKRLDVVVMDRQMLGQESRALLNALLKLRPGIGIVLLCEDAESESHGLSGDVVFADPATDVSLLIPDLVEARSLALRRQEKQGHVSNRQPAG